MIEINNFMLEKIIPHIKNKEKVKKCLFIRPFMQKRGHIINCEGMYAFNQFLEEGYVGVSPINPRRFTSGGRSWAVRTNWDIIADLKRVKPGDLIFLHVTAESEGEIKGVFEATSHFMESPETPEIYKSANLRYYPPEPCWRDCPEEEFGKPDYFWQAGIKELEGYYFKDGFNSTEVFRLAKEGRIWTVPVRWKYADMAKTVRPLLGSEAKELKKLLVRNNLGEPLETSISPKNLSNFSEIRLLLTPYNGQLYDEKILEAWILDNLTQNGNNKTEYNMVTDIFGKLNVFGNTIQAFYLDFMDIFGYIEDKEEFKYGFKVAELKKGEPEEFPLTIKQLTKYMDWVTTELAGGDAFKVEGIIIAKDFSQEYIDYIQQRNSIEYGNKINLVKYDLSDGKITLEKVVG